MNAQLTDIITIVLGCDPSAIDTLIAGEPPWDSLKHMELIFAVEDEFGVSLSSEEIEGIGNYQALLALLETKTGG